MFMDGTHFELITLLDDSKDGVVVGPRLLGSSSLLIIRSRYYSLLPLRGSLVLLRNWLLLPLLRLLSLGAGGEDVINV